MIRRPPRSTLFPSPPLFRSLPAQAERRGPAHLPPADQRAAEPHLVAVEERAGVGDARRGHLPQPGGRHQDRKSTRLNSSHANISYAVFCLKKKNTNTSLDYD